MWKVLKPYIASANENIKSLNNSKYFAGMVIITLNIASRYVNLNLTKSQEKYLKTVLARELLVFSVCWMGTRDIYVSLMMTLVFVFLANYAFNEESTLCVMPNSFKRLKHAIDTDGDGEVSEEELEAALKTLERSKKQKEKDNQLEFLTSIETSGGGLLSGSRVPLN